MYGQQSPALEVKQGGGIGKGPTRTSLFQKFRYLGRGAIASLRLLQLKHESSYFVEVRFIKNSGVVIARGFLVCFVFVSRRAS